MNTKKLLLTSALALTIACPALADPAQPNIAVGTNPADCTEPVLGTTSGTSNLEAGWQANTLYLSWSVDGEDYATNDTNAATCTYDSGIAVPESPEKTGYTFVGWKVLPQCGLNNVDISENIGRDEVGSRRNDHCSYTRYGNDYSGPDCSDSRVSDLNKGEWAATFSYGRVKGTSMVSSTNGTMYVSGNPVENANGDYLWCKVTSLNGVPCSGNAYKWVFLDSSHVVGPEGCVGLLRTDSAWRAALFGITQ